MTTPPESRRPRYLTEPVRVARRVLAPAALELEGQLPALREENAAMRARLDQLEERAGRVDELAALAEQLERQVAELKQDLHESRRLNLRVAELTDLVTELVLPLHDREIDPAVLARLGPDTL